MFWHWQPLPQYIYLDTLTEHLPWALVYNLKGSCAVPGCSAASSSFVPRLSPPRGCSAKSSCWSSLLLVDAGLPQLSKTTYSFCGNMSENPNQEAESQWVSEAVLLTQI
ncbi:hypothetical protein E2C01_072357 [Portunus trituberculatus]|uniref:Uncharacterized protein n=1 Tax=Portunus trituberculatus TaxID=210409 RepID=A0A5B7IAI4_PORTR|nr:hypothetical protein [Portunus trituberculatus]